MKKLLFFFSLLIPCVMNAQYKYYRDSTYNQTFNLLSGTTSVNQGHFWDDSSFNIPIGFTFNMFSNSTDSLYISEFIGFGAYVNMHPVSPTTSNITGIIVDGSDLQDRDTSETGSKSPISYNVSGTSPNQIFKLEWKNAGFYNPIDNGTSFDDSLDLQLWLYETSNIIEVRFGNGNYVSALHDLYDGGKGPWVAIYDSADNNLDARIFYSFKDSVQHAVLDSFSSLSSLSLPPGMLGNPTAGSVYRFIPIQSSGTVGYTSVNQVVSTDINYLNQKNELRIDIFNNDHYQYKVYDIQGHIIMSGNLSKGRKIISTADLSSGMYFVHLNSGKENNTFKFVR